MDEYAVLERIDPAKDVDGLHPMSLGRLVLNKTAPLACTPAGIVELLDDAGADVCVVDLDGRHRRLPRGVRFERGDITRVDDRLAAELGAADVVVLAVPEQVALAALPGLAEALRPGSVLAETLSVKSTITQAAASISGISVVGLNPMFAPSLGIEGRPVAVVVVQDGPGVTALLELIDRRGGRLVTVSAETHDRLAAAVQTLTHSAVLAFGFALTELGMSAAELGAIAPPPHAVMLGMLARICAGTPEVYWDVQAGNPFAPQVREALADGLRRLAEVVDGGEEEFAGAMAELRSFLGEDLEHHLEACARAFAQAAVDSNGMAR
jgi:prephenate dehydrogenase